jgi:FAD/FMN-containing dehydrogenase
MRRSSVYSFVLLEALTGAAREEPEGGAAFGQRAARWNVTALGIWEATVDDDAQIGWARRLADGLKSSSLSGAGYANYSSSDETEERVRSAFGPQRFDRLASVKRRYDPENRFRFNLNVPPEPVA